MSDEIVKSNHDLFPMPESAGEDWEPIAPEDIREIKVYARQGAKKLSIPGPFGPADLPDDAAFFAKFGGGSYDVVAYRHNGTIGKRRSLEFAGPSRVAMADPAASSAAPAPPSSLLNGQVLAAAITGCVTIITAAMANAQAAAAREEQARRELLTLLLAPKNDDLTKELVKAFLARQQPAAAVAPAPTVEEQLAAFGRVQDVVKKLKLDAESPDWLKAVEALGPSAIQILGPMLLAKMGPPGMVPSTPDPQLIQVVQG